MKWSLKEIRRACRVLRRKHIAGKTPAESFRALAEQNPERGTFWKERANYAQSAAAPMSAYLSDIWPESVVAAIEAGEKAGRLPQALESIMAMLDERLAAQAAIKKLHGPVAMIIAGILIGLAFLVLVFPAMGAMTPRGHEPTLLVQTGLAIKTWLITNGQYVALAITGVIAWLTISTVNQAYIAWFDLVQAFRSPARDIAFSQFSRFLGMQLESGLSLRDALQQAARVMPAHYRREVEDFTDHADNGLSAAIQTLSESDSQYIDYWPSNMKFAMATGESVGAIPEELQGAAAELIEDGTEKLEKVTETLVWTGKLITAAMILTIAIGYIMQTALSVNV